MTDSPQSLRSPVSALRSPMSFAYLFAQFPSFVKTFVTREAVEMVKQGMNPWLVSLRKPDDPADFAEPLDVDVTYAPERTPLRAEVNAALAAGKFPLKTNIAFRWNRRAAIFGKLFGKAADSQRIFEAAWLAPQLRARGVRHVHAHFGGVASRTAWWLGKLFGFQYSFTGHANDIFCETNFPVSHADLVRDARFIVTETDYAREWMEKKYPVTRGKVFRVFNGIALAGFPSRTVKPGAVKVVSVGRLVEKKGFGDLIEACRLLRDRGVEIACDILGGGPLEQQLQAQIDRNQLGATVRLLGPKSQVEVRQRMAEAGVFALACMPEKGGGSDNLPTVIMEAMACGAPVVSTRIAGVPEMIRDGEDGLLVAPRDPAALAGAMEKLLRDQALAARIGAQGRATAEEKFSIENTTRALKYLLIRHGGITPPDAAKAADPSLQTAEFA
jgi:colanic acid/amylovoran biosynthesis glycosyltransferase